MKKKLPFMALIMNHELGLDEEGPVLAGASSAAVHHKAPSAKPKKKTG